MKCEVCGDEALVDIMEVHVTEAQSGNTKSERSLCMACAQPMGFDVTADIRKKAQSIRTLAQFIKTNNRMPSSEELRLLGGGGTMPSTAPGTKEFQEQLRHLESLADFLEQHGRFPTEQELPDPF